MGNLFAYALVGSELGITVSICKKTLGKRLISSGHSAIVVQQPFSPKYKHMHAGSGHLPMATKAFTHYTMNSVKLAL